MIFISHAGGDIAIAAALKNFLAESIDIEAEKIFCTCLHDPELAGDAQLSERLKNDITQCGALFAVVTPESVTSGSVLFELGAAWVLGKSLFFICLEGSDFRDLPEPLCGFLAINAEEKDAPVRLTAMCREVASELGLEMKRGADVVASLKALIDAVADRSEQNFAEPDGVEICGDAEERQEESFEEAAWLGADYCEIIFAVDGVVRQELVTVRLFWDDIFMTVAQNLRQAQD
ncbi:MAG: hypothetical protein LBS93_04890, partial [Synergistaceae bacterium]|nr:hypothetical protein [Synergistaceae bacterium]